MDGRREELLKRLLATFKVEAAEHIQLMTTGLLALEKLPALAQRDEWIEILFREIHSLKGAARTVNLAGIERICQSLETVFSALKRKELEFSSTWVDLLTSAVNAIESRLPTVDQPTCEGSLPVDEIVEKLNISLQESYLSPPTSEREQGSYVRENAPADRRIPEEIPVEFKSASPETVRISTARLSSILLQGEEFALLKLRSTQQIVELKTINAQFSLWKNECSQARAMAPMLRRLLAHYGNHSRSGEKALRALSAWIDKNNETRQAIETRLAQFSESINQDHRTMARQVDSFLEEIKKAALFPCRLLLEIFPKLAHDLSRDCGKEADLVIQGGEIEIDRRILEEMKDPLIHLVRNCLDHGIEKPAVRQQKAKPTRGAVTLEITQSPHRRDQIEIRVSDDGAGIDVAKVKAVALRLGLLTEEDARKMSREEMLSLIFHSGVSTTPVITDISGRGLGLAIVREKVERLGGTISVESIPDTGTGFRIVLPLTLITFRGITVRLNEHLFVIPTTYVERVVRIKSEEIKTVENRETIELEQQAVSLARLGEVLGLPRGRTQDDADGMRPLLLIGIGRQRMAFMVDEILIEQEISVKRLGPQLPRVRNIAGATVLGDGKVVPVLDVPDLLKSAVRIAEKSRPIATTPEAKKKCVLVVEDSITARTLLKNILELSGYEVKTAMDGIDALTQLRTGEFDLVVSDVDMPRMNGFELTAKIRQDPQLAELPVVLVTALQSREDRERGIDVGANAYIVKSGFDQGNLLAVIQRLV